MNLIVTYKVNLASKTKMLSKPQQKEVNIIGTFLDRSGMGYQARELANYMANDGYKVKIIHCHHQNSLALGKDEVLATLDKRIETSDILNTDALKYKTNIFAITFSLTLFYYCVIGKKFFNHYNICYAPWEMEYIKDSDARLFSIYNEVWTVSEFCKGIFEKFFSKHNLNIPVKVHTMKADVSNISAVTRHDFNLPENKFLFYFVFDPQSSTQRKNPFAIINAFAMAFKNNENVGLVIKSKEIIPQKNSLFKASYNKMLELAGQDRRITIIAKNIAHNKLLALVKNCDCFVSLHRSEGFGLNILEAFELGKPCIVTNYSGSTDITDNPRFSHLSYPVNYSMVPVDCSLFNLYIGKNKVLWADPDINHAAQLMQQVYSKYTSKN